MLPGLSEKTLASIIATETSTVSIDEQRHDRPERIVQFGTGGFLRGFTDWFVDKANIEGYYDGRIIAIQSTGSARTNTLDAQDGLYTVCQQGLVDGKSATEYSVVSSISRIISANNDWEKVLGTAEIPAIEMIISNTTEVGIQYERDNVFGEPPVSFPAKLTSWLYHRYQRLGGGDETGVIIIPCELVPDNGNTLQSIVLRHSQEHNLGSGFAEWVQHSNKFCNTLVDRIVPGFPHNFHIAEEHFRQLGYSDAMLTCAEFYRLWAIEGLNSYPKPIPGILKSDNGIILTDDLHPFHERKIRLLNGTHTVAASVMVNESFHYVIDSMKDDEAKAFITDTIRNEILPMLESDPAEAARFTDQVLERFANPFLRHEWKNIMLQSTSKWKLRLLPIMKAYEYRGEMLPPGIFKGFQTFLGLTQSFNANSNETLGIIVSDIYWNDQYADQLRKHWSTGKNQRDIISAILRDSSIWDEDLTSILPNISSQILTSFNH